MSRLGQLVSRIRERLPDGEWFPSTLHVVSVTYLAAHVFLAGWIIVPTVSRNLEVVVIESGSMAPSLDPGDIVLLGETDGEVPIGRVVTFEDAAGRIVTHRVVALDDGSLVTKGDANADRDGSTVPPSRIVGVAEVAVPSAGLPILWLRESPSQLVVWLLVTTATIGLATRTRDAAARRDGRRPEVPDSGLDDGEGEDWSWPEPAELR